VEERINKILKEGSYDELYNMLKVDRKTVLDILCKKTADVDTGYWVADKYAKLILSKELSRTLK
jgi:hypothetical protein